MNDTSYETCFVCKELWPDNLIFAADIDHLIKPVCIRCLTQIEERAHSYAENDTKSVD